MDPRLPTWPVVARGVAFGALIATVSRAVRGMPLAPAVIIDAIAGSAHVVGFGLPSRAHALTDRDTDQPRVARCELGLVP